MSEALLREPQARSSVRDASNSHQVPARWWLEPELALLLLFVLGAYFTRMTDLTIRGEESRRGLIAREMLESGDWIVPTCQGEPLFSRPPLQNWLIAALAIVRGDVDAVALRLPSDVALLLTVLLIYGYSRTFLSKLGSLTAGLAYASMGQVLELGRMGETDALFTFFICGSLIGWHLCFMRFGPCYRTWCLGYLFVALGMLTKGPQAPVYFAGVVGAYLLWTGQWRMAFSRAHAAGIGTFALVFGAWQVPFMISLGTQGAGRMYVNDVGHRFMDATLFSFGEHMLAYPFEVFACMLPWSGLLVVWFVPGFHKLIRNARPYFIFLTLCLAVTFPTVWLPPGARPRYFMPLYPCAAILAGLAVDRLWQTAARTSWHVFWKTFVCACSIAMAGAGVSLLVVSLAHVDSWLAQSTTMAWAYAVSSVALAVAAWRSLRIDSQGARRTAVLSIAGFLALSHCGVMISALQNTSVDTAGQVAELKGKLPRDAKLVSFGQMHHLFVFFFHETIPVCSYPETSGEVAGDLDYFCVVPPQLDRQPLPFAWEPIAEINCDRRIETPRRARIIIGHRTDHPATAPLQQASGAAPEKSPIRQSTSYR
ncbi:MAG TPA: glycosyltransferase family 39 protein [Planctomycetaceae bacterium]